jgi:hypothetical protein
MSLIVFAAMMFGALLQQTPKPTLEPTLAQMATETPAADATAEPETAPFEVLTQEDLAVIRREAVRAVHGRLDDL